MPNVLSRSSDWMSGSSSRSSSRRRKMTFGQCLEGKLRIEIMREDTMP
jgi:hypothetical protein